MEETMTLQECFSPKDLVKIFHVLNDRTCNFLRYRAQKQIPIWTEVDAVQDYYENQDAGPQELKSQDGKATLQTACASTGLVRIYSMINLEARRKQTNAFGVQDIEFVKKNPDACGLFIVELQDRTDMPTLVVVR